MRIWSVQLLPFLCRNHLLGAWRESLGAYSIITNGKKGYANHPAVLEYKESPADLYDVLVHTRAEMLKRGYNPKELPKASNKRGSVRIWQTLEEQVGVLKGKGCGCDV